MPKMVRFDECSVDDRAGAQTHGGGDALTHRIQGGGRMPDPVQQLADNSNRLKAAERLRRIAWELLVGHVRIVLKTARRLNDVDARSAVASSQFRTPRRRVERSGEVDVVHHPTTLEIRLPARRQ